MSDTLHFDPQMSDVEALFWSVEDQEPLLRSTIVVVVLFGRGVKFGRVSDRVERMSRILPRFRDRVVLSAVPGVNPRWEPDPDFDLAYHLRRVAAPRPARFETLLRLAEPMASEGIDKARPPWQMLFVEGLPAGQSGLVVKLHHSLTDGLGAVKLGAVLFDLEPDAAPPKVPGPPPATAAVVPGRSPSAFDRAMEDFSREVQRGLSFMRQFGPLVAAGMREMLTQPDGPQSQLMLELVRSAVRVTAPTARALSPVMQHRSLVSRLDLIEAPLADVRAVAKKTGGTVNDVYLASVTAGLEAYHRHHGIQIEGVRLAVPINTRTEDTDVVMRNQVAPTRILAPFGLTDRAERIRVLHELLAAARAEPAVAMVEALAGVANRLPMTRNLISATVGAVDAVVSNVPGSPVPLYLGGAEVVRLVGFGPRGGGALNLTLVSHAGTLRIGINVDPAAVADVDVLTRCLRQGFTETVG